MAAITTIQNFLVQNDVELLGYWNNSVGVLELHQRDAKSATKKPAPKDEPIYVAAATGTVATGTAATGKIMNPSSLAGFMYNSMPTVYGLVDKKVWKLSPVPELLGEEAVIDELPASLAGCSDGASSAWLYFYKGNSTKKQTLKEWNVSDGGLGTGMDNVTVSPTSYLAAVYVGGANNERRVIYQAPNSGPSSDQPGPLNIVNAETGANEPVPSTDNVRARSPIAACATGPDDANKRIYVYYISGGNSVYRVVSKLNSWSTWDEATSPPVFSTKPTAFTQIGLTPVPAEKANYVTYVVEVNGKTTFRAFKDPW